MISELSKHEDVIAKNLTAFYEVGNALYIIREKRLYCELGYTSFGDYCRDRWDMARSRAYQMIASATIMDNLKLSTLVDMPTQETQVRHLSAIAPELQPMAWELANEVSEGLGITPTQAIVKQSVDAIRELMTTRAITIGEEQVSVSELLRGQVSEAVIEQRAVQSQRIADKQKRVLLGSTSAVCINGALVPQNALDLSENELYNIVIYRMGE